MKILITGAKGQLGTELLRVLKSGKTEIGSVPEELFGAEITAVDVEELDIVDLSAVKSLVSAVHPDVIINCAAYTNVDRCETDRDAAFQVNALGARNLAIAAQRSGAKLIHVSTDYVFGGDGTIPYSEWDLCAPKSVYGASKRLGEEYVADFCSRFFIVRTSWLYGYVGKNFVKTMMRVGKERGELTIVNDQRGNPTNAADLAHHLLKLAVTEEYGIYHCTGNGECTWYDFACEIIRLAKIPCNITPCTSEEYPSPTPRPAYSSLDNRMLRCTVGDEMRDWKEALQCFMSNYQGEN